MVPVLLSRQIIHDETTGQLLPLRRDFTPHERFIIMAKEQGLKFTFGSDTRDKKAGRLDYCKQIAKKCKLTKDDFFIPDRQLKDHK